MDCEWDGDGADGWGGAGVDEYGGVGQALSGGGDEVWGEGTVVGGGRGGLGVGVVVRVCMFCVYMYLRHSMIFESYMLKSKGFSFSPPSAKEEINTSIHQSAPGSCRQATLKRNLYT